MMRMVFNDPRTSGFVYGKRRPLQCLLCYVLGLWRNVKAYLCVCGHNLYRVVERDTDQLCQVSKHEVGQVSHGPIALLEVEDNN